MSSKTNSSGFREERGLTPGEIAMARLVFGDSINYTQVRIYGKKYLNFPKMLGGQPDDIVMAPDGNIYFSPKDALQSHDFSGPPATFAQKKLFMHEMTHVWQNHSGRDTSTMVMDKIKSLFTGGYEYTLDSSKKLSDYNMEQQAQIISHYYMLRYDRGVSKSGKTIAEFEQVLSEFLKDPFYDKKKIEQERRESERLRDQTSTHGPNALDPKLTAADATTSFNHTPLPTVREQVLTAFGPELNGVKTDAFRTVVTGEQLRQIRQEVPLGAKSVDIVTSGPKGEPRYQTVYHVGQLGLNGQELNLALQSLNKNFEDMINTQAVSKGFSAPYPEVALAPDMLQLKEQRRLGKEIEREI